MPLKAPEAYELDRSESPAMDHSHDEDSDVSDVDEFDPLRSSGRPYTDDASQPIRSVFDSEKNGSFSKQPLAWLDTQRKRGWLQRWLIPSRFCCVLILLFVATLVLLLSAGGIWVYKAAVPDDGESEPWYPTPRGGTVESWKDAYKKAADLVGQMTLVEKVNITSGIGWSMGMCVGNTGPVDRLGFPSLCLQDGPLGLRFVDNATAWPAGITVGATWNKELMYERGKGHGFEAKKKGINVILGPSMGPIGRLPAGGRNWEGFGSDPTLQGIAAAQTIKGIQDTGVMATAKHYVGNEQEHFRQSWEWGTPNAISSNIDDRAMHEIYAWPFADSVRAGVASVMCSYNQLNNSYACQNSKLMNGILKDEMGFQGFVQSDWLAQRSGVASALAGLDMTMPGDGLKWADGNSLWGAELTKAVLNTSVPMERLNDMVTRVVAAWYQLGQDDKDEWPAVADRGGPNFSSWTDDKEGELHPGSPNSKETGVVNKYVPVRKTDESGDHDALARKIATEGIVLVKNSDSMLPLNRTGKGVVYKAGTEKIKVGIFGEDAFPNPNGNNACEDRGCNVGTLAMGWGSGAVELPYLVSSWETLKANFVEDRYEVTQWRYNDDHEGAASMASEQRTCIVFINSDAGEGFLSWDGIKGDRNDLHPQKNGDALVKNVAEHCENTIVVVHTVGPTILEEWIEVPAVKAVMIAHLPGQESGNAIADVLFGDVNPSGRLPYTIAKKEEDYGPSSGILFYPNGIVPQQNFSEGLYIDYRYFDKHDIEPRYEFGYGLSYVDFKLNSLVVNTRGSIGELPKGRPKGLKPPKMDDSLPSPESALWPEGMRKLKKYIYPYIDSTSDIKKGAYPYPRGYGRAHELSPAGGGEGGNPDLFETAVVVQASLTNLGDIPAACVVQVYISYPSNVTDTDGEPVDMPVKVLRAFEKYYFDEPKRVPVKLELTRRDLSYWDVKRQNWVIPQGEFTLHLGFSSRDLPMQSTFSTLLGLNLRGNQDGAR
ncbi:hypothetical protein LTR37_002740 [Vermiconidia calcicola]|uniref:Uncharacterized protein n=1 Tax=Vermiconidia calcicola TaxID=1690605 RepID=A0ACC3NUG2_9PEZI|nr:hypothetical protein LTR37_002740 [Vermiconidia calcicola]